MEIEPGGTFAGYRVVSALGAGGMGTVYVVEHPHLMRREALKVISVAMADPTARERFTREARSAAALRHPGIVGIHDFGIEDGTPWFTMDYLAGSDLQEAGRLDRGEAMQVVARVAAALDYAHSRGVVHRDVKPANILITRSATGDLDDVVVLDFGIARALDDDTGLTGTSVFIGSLAFGAPEAFRGETAGPEADQYSLAVTAYRLLTGAMPFAATSPHELMRAHLFDAPRRMSSVVPELGPVDEVLARAFAKDPAHRYATCTEFAEALAEATKESVAGRVTQVAAQPNTLLAPTPPEFVETAAHPTVLAPPGSSRVVTPGRHRRPWLVGGALAVVLALTVAVGVWVTQGRGGDVAESGAASDEPAKLVGPLVPSAVSGGCIIASGSVFCWGDNDYGQLGDGTTENRSAPVEVVGLAGAAAVSASDNHSCAITDAKAYCWGYNGEGQLGAGNTSDSPKPVEIPGLTGVTAISAGYDHTCALADGQVYCWGVNRSGQVGNGTTSDRELLPVRVSSLPGTVTSISAGARRTCAVASTRVYCWGQDLAAASVPSTNALSPVIVGGLDQVSEVSVGTDHVCALSVGAVNCWGENDMGRLGVGPESPGSTTPVAVPGISQATQVSAGGMSSCAVVAGAAYCWGYGGSGQLGNGVAVPQSPPTRVAGLTGVTQIAVANGVCALAGGAVYCWGSNVPGRPGDGSTKDSSVPERVVLARN